MLDPQITTVLFDLDGTLLPMELEQFTNTYFGLLAKKAAPFGYDPKTLVAAVWKGTKAMVKNDGTETNDKRFWDTFAGELGEEVLKLRPVFDGFYANEFHGARAACGENPLARRAIDGLKAKGYDVVLATNPISPWWGWRRGSLGWGCGPRISLTSPPMRTPPPASPTQSIMGRFCGTLASAPRSA